MSPRCLGKKSLETKNPEEMVEDGSMSLLLKDGSLEDQSGISVRILEGGREVARGRVGGARGEVDAFASCRGELERELVLPSVPH